MDCSQENNVLRLRQSTYRIIQHVGPGGKFTDEQRNLYLRLLERDLASLPYDKDVKRFYHSVMDLVTENLTDVKQLDPDQEGNGCS